MNISYIRNSIIACAICFGLNCSDSFARIPSGHADTGADTLSLGYYQLPAKSFTGAVSVVYGSELESIPEVSLPRTFPGRFTGLTTKESNAELGTAANSPEVLGMDMFIRGISTTNYSAPMLIVDGVLCPNTTWCYITPEEIETIAVLKDAAALSLYGLQGANGLIVITTKKGHNGKMDIRVNVNQAVQQMTKTPLHVNSATYARLRNEAGYNDGLGSYSQFTQETIDHFAAGDSELYPDNDWYSRYMRPLTSMTRAAVSVKGGSEKVQYYSNVNYMHQQMPFSSDSEKNTGKNYNATPGKDWFNFRSNVDVSFNDYLSGFLRLSGNVQRDKSTAYANSTIYGYTLATPPDMYGPLTPEGEVSTIDEIQIPVYGMLYRSGYIKSLTTNINAQAGLDFDMSFLTEGLRINGLMSYQSTAYNQSLTTQDFERYTRTDDYSRLEFEGPRWSNTNSTLSYSKSSYMTYNLNVSGKIDYGRTFGAHRIDAMAYVFYMNQETLSSNLPYRKMSSGLTATYGVLDRYFIKADIGYTGSDQFARGHRFTPTPSISAAWVISDEPFLKKAAWLTNLKLRASYGISTNDNFDRYLFMDQISLNGAEGILGNPDLRAEVLRRQNYGFDLGLFRDFTLSFDWYRTDCSNMLIVPTSSIPEYQGYPLGNFPRENRGRMTNHGLDLSAMYTRQLKGGWSFYAGGIFSYTDNRILYTDEAPYGDDYIYRYRQEGYRIGQQWGYEVDYANGNGYFNSQEELDRSGLKYSFGQPRIGDLIYKDQNNDGIIDERDQVPVGKSHIPLFSYGISAGFRYRGLELNLHFQGAGGSTQMASGTTIYENAFRGVFTDIHMNAWTPERYAAGEDISFPALSLNKSTNHTASTFFSWNTSYFRLKNAEVAYTLPVTASQKIAARSIRFSLSAQNLFTLHRLPTRHMDPEIFNMSTFQMYRTYNLGISLIF